MLISWGKWIFGNLNLRYLVGSLSGIIQHLQNENDCGSNYS